MNQTYEKLPDYNIVVVITKDVSGKVIGSQSYTPEMVDNELVGPTAQLAKLNAIKSLFVIETNQETAPTSTPETPAETPAQ